MLLRKSILNEYTMELDEKIATEGVPPARTVAIDKQAKERDEHPVAISIPSTYLCSRMGRQ